jgi:hypothetical protein
LTLMRSRPRSANGSRPGQRFKRAGSY